MLGRAWHYALGAIGADGPKHLYDILMDDLTSNMIQIAATKLDDLPNLLHKIECCHEILCRNSWVDERENP